MDLDILESCFCVRISPMKKVVEESSMRNMGTLRICGEEETWRSVFPISWMVFGDDEGVQVVAILAANISMVDSSGKRILFSFISSAAASQ